MSTRKPHWLLVMQQKQTVCSRTGQQRGRWQAWGISGLPRKPSNIRRGEGK